MPSPIEKVLARLEEMGQTVIHYGAEYRTQCPAHHGKNTNLAFSEGNDGRLLATCHSKKCSFEEIAKSLGFEPHELMGTAVLHPTTLPEKKVGPRGRKIHKTLKAATFAAAFGISPNLQREPDCIYPYHSANGSEDLFACRWNLTQEEQQQLGINDHKQIRYVSTFRDGYIVGTEPGRLYPIYAMDELARILSDPASGTVRIYICEGEKAAECARSLGLTATCTPFGSESAAKADWTTLDRLAVQNKKALEIIIFPDHDDAGEEYARSLGAIFGQFESKPAVKTIRFAQCGDATGIENFPDKGDICELCELLDSKSNEDIRELIERIVESAVVSPIELLPVIEPTRPRELECIWDESVEPQEITFAWKDRIPYGKLILLNGLGSAGKTFIICSFMATITSGALWPDGQKADQGCVIYFTTEDGIQDTISKRFRDNGGNPAYMCYYQRVINNIEHQDEEFVLQEMNLLEELINKIERERGPVRMVVFDPITAFTGKIDENKNNQVRSILAPLMRLTDLKKFACIGVIHPKKGATLSGTAAEGVAGSSGYVNAARRVWQVFYDKENAVRYMLVAKNNLCEDPKGLAYIINDGIVSFTDTDVDMDADAFLNHERKKFLKSPSKHSNIEDVENWLTEYLGDGAKPSGQYGSGDESTVFGAGEKKGFSKNSIYQAKKNLGIEARKTHGEVSGWLWSLPISNLYEPQDDFKKYSSGDF